MSLSLKLTAGLTGDTPDGGVAVVYNPADWAQLEASVNTGNFQDVFSTVTASVLLPDNWEGGASVTLHLNTPELAAIGFYGKTLFQPTGTFKIGPSLALSFANTSIPTIPGIIAHHETQVCTAPESGGGIFGNDQGSGGCQNRTATLAENALSENRLIPSPSALFNFEVGFGDFTLEAYAGLAAGFVPNFTISPLLGGALKYTF